MSGLVWSALLLMCTNKQERSDAAHRVSVPLPTCTPTHPLSLQLPKDITLNSFQKNLHLGFFFSLK